MVLDTVHSHTPWSLLSLLPLLWLVAVFFSLLLGIHGPSREQEGTDNPLFRCWETGTCQGVVIAVFQAQQGAGLHSGKDGRADLINIFHP